MGPSDDELFWSFLGRMQRARLPSPGGSVAVDMNPRQNALLELKLAGIRSLHSTNSPHVR